MNPAICVSLGGGMPFEKCLQLASTWSFVELRLDMMKPDTGEIELLAMQCRQWIATCRPGNITEHERTTLLSAAIRAGATYVDIEYEADCDYRRKLTALAGKYGCKVIISYHNFESTPDIDTLNQIIRNSFSMGADRVKIAVTAKSAGDCAGLMSLYAQHDNIVAFAMGKAGKITRIAAPFAGADFTYASADEAHLTAPGQLTASQMEVIFRILS